MKANVATCRLLLLFCLFLLLGTVAKAGDSDVLQRTIYLPKSKATVYQLLGMVTDRTGCSFLYDSKLVNNEQIVKLRAGNRTVRQAIYKIIGNDRLKLRLTGNHILIYQSDTPVSTNAKSIQQRDSVAILTVSGTLFDKYTKDPIPYGTVSVSGTSLGSVTNQNGMFKLNLPDSLRNAQIRFSHLGYLPQEIEIAALTQPNQPLTLEPRVIPIQEVIIRVANPLRLLREMLDAREKNYAHHPVYFTSFYREGIEHKNRFINLTEAVFKIYKTSYQSTQIADQVKLLKMRRISNEQVKDTLIAKMKSGINACMLLDIIKDLPEFLTPATYPDLYSHSSSDITVIDNRIANVVSFEPHEGRKEPLYRGELYIDSENSALLGARFELDPKNINRAGNLFVEKKSRNITITPQKVVYTVSYKPWNGTYYINHVRGDLYFKMKKKKFLATNSTLHTWFEMVTCKIDTEQVSRFTRSEKLSTRTIFADTHFGYDEEFWQNFNVIPPETELSEAIGRISSKIEETGY